MSGRRLVLVGGGHSHVEVLRQLARRPVRGLRTVLVSRELQTPYSGMLPGVIAGHYLPAEGRIDLSPLCAAAGVELIRDTLVGLETARARVHCARQRELSYDWLSLNTGSVPGQAGIAGSESFGIPVKPIGDFLPRWQRFLREAAERGARTRRIAVVGGGAGGVELVLAAEYRLRRVERQPDWEFCLVESAENLLPASSPRLGNRLRAILESRGIGVHTGARVIAAQPGQLSIAGGEPIAADEVLWVTPAAAPDWAAAAGLAVDACGFVRVDHTLRSVSHPQIFAAGDLASVGSEALPKAGVHAVRQGPVLAANLRRVASGRPCRRYRPQRRFLVLVSTGNRHAVAGRGRWTAEGAWAWYWKRWLDQRFVRRYRPRR